MRQALLAEWRKLTTIRSTYVLVGLALLLVAAMSFMTSFSAKSNPTALGAPNYVYNNVLGAMNLSTLFISLAAMLLITHEYRYNTIFHTLIANRRRSVIVFAKALIVALFAVFLALLTIVVATGMLVLGAKVHGLTMGDQNLALWDIVWRADAYGICYGLLSLWIGMLLRNQVAGIVTIIVFPGIGEALLTLLLKDNSKFLPFHNLDMLIGQNSLGMGNSSLPTAAVLAVAAAYVVVGGLAAWWLLDIRDATKGGA